MKQKEKTKIETLPVFVPALEKIKASYFVIQEKLPSLNEWTKKINNNRFGGNNFKKGKEKIIRQAIETAKNNSTLKPLLNTPLFVSFTWYEPTTKRDLDNIFSSKKFILDALKDEKVIAEDNQANICGFNDRAVIDKKFCGGCIVELVDWEDTGRVEQIKNKPCYNVIDRDKLNKIQDKEKIEELKDIFYKNEIIE